MTWELFTEQHDKGISFFSVVYTDEGGDEMDKDKATNIVIREYVEGELVKVIHGILE